MEKRRIGFVIFLIVGNIAVGSPIFYYLGKDITFQFIAFFTSISTAAYAILNEPKKPQPLLRIQLIARAGYEMGSIGFDLLVDNIGDATAKDIKVMCKTSPRIVEVEENGIYNIKLIAPKETNKINVLTSIQESQVSSLRIDVEITYSSIENKKQTPIKESFEVKNLIKKMTDDALIGRKSVF